MLKKLAFILFILCCSGIAKAQIYFGFGYNLGYAKLDSLNYVLHRYNQTRAWLDDTMPQIHVPNGFVVSVEAFQGDFFTTCLGSGDIKR